MACFTTLPFWIKMSYSLLFSSPTLKLRHFREKGVSLYRGSQGQEWWSTPSIVWRLSRNRRTRGNRFFFFNSLIFSRVNCVLSRRQWPFELCAARAALTKARVRAVCHEGDGSLPVWSGLRRRPVGVFSIPLNYSLSLRQLIPGI